MNDFFLNTFLSVSQGILKIFIIAGVAGILTWRKVIKQSFIDGLSNITVYVFLPALIFNTITTGFNPQQDRFWWIIPLSTIVVLLAGMGIASLLFLPDFKKHRNILPLASMQNAAYLVLPIGEFVYPDQFDKFAVYCFLVVLGISPLYWSIGYYLVTERKKTDFRWQQLLTPPLLVNAISIILVLTTANRYIPVVLEDSIDMLGSAAVPAATFILGATLASVVRTPPGFWETFRISFVKFIVMPVIAIALLFALHVQDTNPLLADVMVIQSAAAPATAFILQVRTYGGDLKKIGGITFISYFLTLIAIPIWLTVWKMITL